MKRNIRGDEKQSREMKFGDVISEEERTIEVSISSELPVSRWDGDEILVHTEEAIDFTRFPLPLLVGHRTYELNIGKVENPVIKDKKLRGIMRFGERDVALDIWKDVRTKIIDAVSIGYEVYETKDIDKHSYKASRWMPYETSLVGVAADHTVGVGRSFESHIDKLSREIEDASPEEQKEILSRVSSLVEKYTPENPDDSEAPTEDGPLISPNVGRQIALKEKLIIMETE